MDTVEEIQLAFREDQAFYKDGGTLASRIDLSQDELEGLYADAHQSLCDGDPKRAATLFTCLMWLDHHNVEYWLGLGIAYQAMQQHRNAVVAFSSGMRYVPQRDAEDGRLLQAMAPSLEVLGFAEYAQDVLKLDVEIKEIGSLDAQSDSSEQV